MFVVGALIFLAVGVFATIWARRIQHMLSLGTNATQLSHALICFDDASFIQHTSGRFVSAAVCRWLLARFAAGHYS